MRPTSQVVGNIEYGRGAVIGRNFSNWSGLATWQMLIASFRRFDLRSVHNFFSDPRFWDFRLSKPQSEPFVVRSGTRIHSQEGGSGGCRFFVNFCAFQAVINATGSAAISPDYVTFQALIKSATSGAPCDGQKNQKTCKDCPSL